MEVVSLGPQPWLSIGYTSSEDLVAGQVNGALALVYALASELGVPVAGSPLSRFSDRNGPSFRTESGFPLRESVDLSAWPLATLAGRCSVAGYGPLRQQLLPATKAITTLHRGPYATLAVAHRTLRSWGRDNDFEFYGGPWEVYVSDPLMASDPRTLETRLYQPIL
jgi:hypothetical protein